MQENSHSRIFISLNVATDDLYQKIAQKVSNFFSLHSIVVTSPSGVAILIIERCDVLSVNYLMNIIVKTEVEIMLAV